MENSKAQNTILKLGKAIVKELELDPGVDTLSKWMAHYVAEMIVSAENLSGDKKTKAEKQCFDIILKIWEHRWSIPRDKPFLLDFESLFETVDKLNPDKNTPFFFPPEFIFELEEGIMKSETSDSDNKSEIEKDENENAQIYLDSALRVDKLARSLIANLLKQAVSGIKLSEERQDLILNSIEAIDYPESRIIRISSDYNKRLESQKEEADEIQNRISEINCKLNDLIEMKSILESLEFKFKKELLELEK